MRIYMTTIPFILSVTHLLRTSTSTCSSALPTVQELSFLLKRQVPYSHQWDCGLVGLMKAICDISNIAWDAICGMRNAQENALGNESSFAAIFIWHCHQQMAPHSNSSRSEP